MVDQYTKEAFEPHVGSSFRFRLEEASEPVSLELVDVTPGPEHPAVRQFSLLFRGGLDAALPRSIHRLEHDALEPMDVYIERVLHPDAGHGYYEVVFSLLEGAGS